MVPDRLLSAARETPAPEIARRAFEQLVENSSQAYQELEDSCEIFLRNLGDLVILSPPMLECLLSHPEWLAWLRGRVERRQAGKEEWQIHSERALREWLSGYSEGVTALDRLRQYKRREYLEIFYLDLAGLAGFDEVVKRLSWLAQSILSRVLEYCWSALVQTKVPPEPLVCPEGFAVVALGKLGGFELNYSSDIDLVFFRRPSTQEGDLQFFTQLGESLVRSLSQPGADGFLYRVDMRLRPHGETGPLVPSITNLVGYYESWAEAWERQALVKARAIAGDQELGRRFDDFVAQFTYARQMDDSSLEEIKRVKYRSEKEYALHGDRIHLKQGPGGIRDIEFYVQYLQLIGGSNHPQLRTGSTLKALSRLAEAKLLLEGEESQLALGYRFLRIVEHRLQLRALTPNSILPQDNEELDLLARGLGFSGAGPECIDKFLSVLENYRGRVRSILERIYLNPGYLFLEGPQEELAQLLTERTPRARIREILSTYGFQDTDKAWQNIRLLAVGPAGRILPPAERRAFLGLAFTLLEVLRDSLDPDQALHHLESFATASGNRISFLRSLASRKSHLLRLANLLALSNSCQQILTRHPEYFDVLARGLYLEQGRSCGEMYRELEERLHQTGPRAGKEDVLRRYRQREMVRIAYRDLAALAGPLEISLELSELAEACVDAALSLSTPSQPLLVVALGKLGSKQMHYASDLDLLFLYDGPSDEPEADIRAQLQRAQDGSAERILHLLAGVTSEGFAYRVDLRLRPEGASGLLARSWTSFEDYARQYMQPWERMALVRSRLLQLQATDLSRWHSFLEEVVYRFTWDEHALEEIRHLKRRIENEKSRETRNHLDFKYGRGGIADLEFLVQFLQILHGREEISLRTPSLDEAVTALSGVGVLSSEEALALHGAHRFQRHVENHYQLSEEWPSREISRESPQLIRLARSLAITGATPGETRKNFLAAWDEHAQIVRALVEKYFYAT